MAEVERALVIDDDGESREALTHALRMQGLEVTESLTGHQGLVEAVSLRPDLISIHQNLADFDGIELCRRVREFSDAYIIIISTSDDESEHFRCLELGADDVLTVPVNPRELRARVTAWFRHTRGTLAPKGGADSYAHGDLALELTSRLVTVAGQEVTLTKTQFDILAVLLSNPRRVWSREALLNAVWGDTWGGDPHLVEVHVGNLRRQLSRHGRRESLIRTVRGVGYRMESPGGR